MRKFLSILLVLALSFGFVINDAYAKRFGGGRSFGASRTTSSFSRPQSAMAAKSNPMSNVWMNRLAGLALGGMLAYLFMNNGFASGILSWLLVAGAVFLVISFIRNRKQMATQSASNYFRDNLQRSDSFTSNQNHYAQQHHTSASYPTDFDAQTFLRDAKGKFLRLQAAYDKKDLNQVRDATTAEVFAEIQLQFHERGEAENITEVVSLDAVLLDAATESKIVLDAEENIPVASVRFSGMIRENNQVAEPFNETWHFQKDLKTAKWLVSGIQQS